MYKPIPEEAKYAQLIKDIKQYVADENNWNYIKPNEDYTTYSIGKSSEIFYFGTYHIKDSQDQLVEILTNEFDRFINQYGENTIFLIEDWLTQIYINKKEAIEKRGERGLLMYLGQRFNVQITPIDYDRSEIFNILDSTFDMEAVDLFAYLYLVKSKLDKEKTELKDYKKKSKEYTKSSFNWIKRYDNKFTTQYFEDLYKKFTNKKLSDDIQSNVFDILNPIKSKNTLSSIFKMYHSIRDENFLYQICANYIEGKNVFVVLGQDHALFDQEFLTNFTK